MVFRLGVASDDSATVYLNGVARRQGPEADHEFAYWNRDVELPPKALKPGKNVIAVLVRNKTGQLRPVLRPGVDRPGADPAAAKKKEPRHGRRGREREGAEDADEGPPTSRATRTRSRSTRRRRRSRSRASVAVREAADTWSRSTRSRSSPPTRTRGQKAHETVLTFKGVRPSDVHKALESLGLKPGKPAYGEGTQAAGPEVKVFLEITGTDGKPERIPIEKCLVHRDTGKPMVGAQVALHRFGHEAARPGEGRQGLRRRPDRHVPVALPGHRLLRPAEPLDA